MNHPSTRSGHRIANITQVLRKHPGNSAITALNREFGQNSDLIHWIYCGWGNKRLGLQIAPTG